VDLAFRMLGDIGLAEDVVQDAFTRLMHADLGEIEDERGWLIVVTSRLCLDQIKSARSRRERAHDASEIEYVARATAHDDGGQPADPADRVTFDDSVRLALLVMLERLSPSERVAFVLHDIFRMPFEEIAESVGRPVPTCRQLARRARQKIAAGQEAVRFDVPAAEHRQVTEKFIAACARGDLNGLVEVLAPDAWGDVDLGPDAARRPPVVTGAEHVARNLLHYWGQPATLVSLPVGGQPALLGFIGRELAGVLVLTMREEVIQTVHVIGDPRKLGFLRAQLQA
jgi:RNA polymerase sigma-70 factor (ECF subfamily)